MMCQIRSHKMPHINLSQGLLLYKNFLRHMLDRRAESTTLHRSGKRNQFITYSKKKTRVTNGSREEGF